MYNILLFLSGLLIIYIIVRRINIENFLVWDYEYALSNVIPKDHCPIQGTIEQIDNPSSESCYRGYYIPYIYDFGDYVSEVQPQI